MANRLYDIDVSEVSGVDRAANRRRFLLLKAAGTAPVGAELPDQDGVGGGQPEDIPAPIDGDLIPRAEEDAMDGIEFPKRAFAYAPCEDPRTWRFRLWDQPQGISSMPRVRKAIKGFNRAIAKGEIDPGSGAVVKAGAKLMRYFRKADQAEREAIAKINVPWSDGEDFTDFDAAYSDVKADKTLEHLGVALMQTVDSVLDSATMKASEKDALLKKICKQFRKALAAEGLLKGGAKTLPKDYSLEKAIAKRGAKISASRRRTLMDIHHKIGQLLSETDPAPDLDGIELPDNTSVPYDPAGSGEGEATMGKNKGGVTFAVVKAGAKPKATWQNPDPDHDGDNDLTPGTDTDHDYFPGNKGKKGKKGMKKSELAPLMERITKAEERAEAAEKEAEKAKKVAKSERELREVAEMTKIAKAHEHLGGTVEERTTMLLDLKKNAPQSYEKLMKSLDALAAQAEENLLLKEFGRTGSNTNLDEDQVFMAKVNEKVESIQKSASGMDRTQALVKAYNDMAAADPKFRAWYERQTG